MTNVLHWDLESRGVVDLKKAGVYVYSESPATDVWLASFARNDDPIHLWHPGDPVPSLWEQAVAEGWLIASWNASFERIMLRNILAPRYGWPQPKLENWRCPMAFALAMGFPPALENSAPAIGLGITKDAQGTALMKRMARPRKVNEDGTYVWWDEPDKIKRLGEYCIQDTEVERAIWKRLCPLSADEQQLWQLDAEINDRGVYIDLDFCNAANKIVTTAATRLKDGMIAATGGAVPAPSNVGALKTFCAENGVETDSLRKDRVVTLLATEDLPDAVREALELRQAGGKTSLGKIDAALLGRSKDGRAKGLFGYHVATTGRWAGRRVQLQNMQRPDMVDVEQIQADILTGDYDIVEMFHGAPLIAIGNAIRGIIRATP